MNLEVIFLKSDSPFSAYVAQWAQQTGIAVSSYESREHEEFVDGVVLITANQSISKELYDLYLHFDNRNIPSQKIDINGTLQVALTSFNLWMKGNKCKRVLIVGADDLVGNENLERFFKKLQETSFATS